MYENAWTEATKQEDKDRILEDFVFYDNGVEEVVISRKDITKAVAATPMNLRATIFEIVDVTLKDIVTTIGYFLDYAKPAWRDENISELLKYQYGEKEVELIHYLPSLPESEYEKLLDEGNIISTDTVLQGK